MSSPDTHHLPHRDPQPIPAPVSGRAVPIQTDPALIRAVLDGLRDPTADQI
ncbi:hypothetical protein ACWF9G_23055 [Nocardia sp. NPDC055029]